MSYREDRARRGFEFIQQYCGTCHGCSPKECIFAYEVSNGLFKGDYGCIFQTAPINIFLPERGNNK